MIGTKDLVRRWRDKTRTASSVSTELTENGHPDRASGAYIAQRGERGSPPSSRLSLAGQPAGKMIYPLVREMAAAGARIRVPVAVACRVLGFSTQGYFKCLKEPVSRRDRQDAEVINKLVDLHEDDPTLGYRFLTDELEHEGIAAGENRVHRLCQIGGIQASHAKRKGKAGRPGLPVHDDLLAFEDEHGRIRHHFIAKAPNQIWLT